MEQIGFAEMEEAERTFRYLKVFNHGGGDALHFEIEIIDTFPNGFLGVVLHSHIMEQNISIVRISMRIVQ